MTPGTGKKIPIAVKIPFTAFFVVWLWVYLRDYGWTNLLYFCDVAMLLTIVAIWTERPIWASMPAVGILVPQSLWIVDFLAEAVGGRLTGMTGYMFDEADPLFTRALSLFHFWLPILLLWMVARLGYDRRAFLRWTLLAWVVVLVCYFWMPAPAPLDTRADNRMLPVNINYVHGFSKIAAQTMFPPLVYLGLMMIILPTVIFSPAHYLLNRWWGRGGNIQ